VLASIVNVLLSALKDLSDFQFFPEDKECFLLFFDAKRKLDEGRSMEREEGEEFNMLVVASFVLRDVLSRCCYLSRFLKLRMRCVSERERENEKIPKRVFARFFTLNDARTHAH
jgi:hypothetical protein